MNTKAKKSNFCEALANYEEYTNAPKQKQFSADRTQLRPIYYRHLACMG
jgi:hypothetical protein